MKIGKQKVVYNKVDQQYNSNQNEFLWPLLANPANNSHLYAYNLQRLIEDFPQSGILQALFAQSGGGNSADHASVYFNPNSLYKLLNEPLAFNPVPGEKIIIQNSLRRAYAADSLVPNKDYITDTVPAGEDVAPIIENSISTVPQNEALEDATIAAIDEPVSDPIAEKNIERISVRDVAAAPESNSRLYPEQEKSTEGNTEAANYFKLDEALDDTIKEVRNAVVSSEKQEIEPEKIVFSEKTERKNITKYHDETMPYSFLWWLNKTRKEHAGIYQPYAKSETGFSYNFNKSKINIDELQHQYFENIFHLTSVEELDKNTANKSAGYDTNRKEHQIIERFIKEEPQIKPQQSDKLDNENKAKKSSEDHDELITETLAAIYTEQMLYHKAIASYKKLMLKFPEKSRYFADKIEQLEKKTNI